MVYTQIEIKIKAIFKRNFPIYFGIYKFISQINSNNIDSFKKSILDNSFKTLGLMETFLAIGMMFGSYLVIKMTKKIAIKYILIIGIIIDGVTFFPF